MHSIFVKLYPENESFMTHVRRFLPYLTKIFRLATQSAFYIDIDRNTILYYYENPQIFEKILNPLSEKDLDSLENTSQFDHLLLSACLLPRIPDKEYEFILEITKGDPDYAFPIIIRFFESLSKEISFRPIDSHRQIIHFKSEKSLTAYLLTTVKKFDDIFKKKPELLIEASKSFKNKVEPLN